MESPTQFLLQSDEVLARIIPQVPAPVIISTGDVFHDLMSCLIEQQIHYRSTKRLFARLLEQAQLGRLSPANFSQFEEVLMAKTKLSTAKYASLVAVCAFWAHHPPDFNKLSDAEVRTALSTIKGIGPWTIDMILLYTLERPSVFPADDYHLKGIMGELYGLPSDSTLKKKMLAISAAWGAHSSLAVKYLLAYKALKRKKNL
ncbi:hypothetical protein QWY31_08495 [Cytophagales bacterium LB-30]|uniref:DNA-3-methyladenine glycosylase II n=1 Tax=Shiella aurantiaca TaxID=3058365 RepID=A0ABT8F4Z0_9BACT|nr:hypothetical protein [Shiella aurantiaca]MDN4165537.1 hypothetical protein [Shiella aurantiaca]